MIAFLLNLLKVGGSYSIHASAFMDDAVVLDSGSGVVKAGFDCADVPSCVFRTVIGKKKRNKFSTVLDDYIGNDALDKK